jgi:hypothetical protein
MRPYILACLAVVSLAPAQAHAWANRAMMERAAREAGNAPFPPGYRSHGPQVTFGGPNRRADIQRFVNQENGWQSVYGAGRGMARDAYRQVYPQRYQQNYVQQRVQPYNYFASPGQGRWNIQEPQVRDMGNTCPQCVGSR